MINRGSTRTDCYCWRSAYERSGSIELAEKQYADVFKASKFDANGWP